MLHLITEIAFLVGGKRIAAKIKNNNNNVGKFLEQTKFKEHAMLGVKLERMFIIWCERNAVKNIFSTRAFYNELKSNGLEKKHMHGNRVGFNLSL